MPAVSAVSALPAQLTLQAPSPQQGLALASVSGRPHWQQKPWLHVGNALPLPAAASAAERAGANGPGAAHPLADNSGGTGQATDHHPIQPVRRQAGLCTAIGVAAPDGGIAAAPGFPMPPSCSRTH